MASLQLRQLGGEAVLLAGRALRLLARLRQLVLRLVECLRQLIGSPPVGVTILPQPAVVLGALEALLFAADESLRGQGPTAKVIRNVDDAIPARQGFEKGPELGLASGQHLRVIRHPGDAAVKLGIEGGGRGIDVNGFRP